jgi:hypothetical protein
VVILDPVNSVSSMVSSQTPTQTLEQSSQPPRGHLPAPASCLHTNSTYTTPCPFDPPYSRKLRTHHNHVHCIEMGRPSCCRGTAPCSHKVQSRISAANFFENSFRSTTTFTYPGSQVRHVSWWHTPNLYSCKGERF